MNMNDYQLQSQRTHPKANFYSKLSNYALGVVSESGEVADELKKVIYHGHILNVEEIEKELGDVLHYVAGLATFLELDMDTIAQKNIDKLKKRFPDGFSEEASRNRVEYGSQK